MFIPLRLGLTQINSIYFRALKSTFAFPQTLGILGGRPKHALYFVGCCGDSLIYLDPHTTQPAVNLADDLKQYADKFRECNTEEFSFSGNNEDGGQLSSSPIDDNTVCPPFDAEMDDVSYHCDRACRLTINQIDPSISLCFLCKTEEDFDQWATLTLNKLIHEEQQPLFEIMKQRPANWPQFEDDIDVNQLGEPVRHSPKSACSTGGGGGSGQSGGVGETFTPLESDEEFEIID